MANIFRCDRCALIVEDPNRIMPLSMPVIFQVFNKSTKSVHYCEKCTESLVEWMSKND